MHFKVRILRVYIKYTSIALTGYVVNRPILFIC